MPAYALKVFTYWEGPWGPVQEVCHRSVQRLYGHDHHLITPETIGDHIDDIPQEVLRAKQPVFRADFFRAALLYKYGGLWLDSDILMLRDAFAAVGDSPTVWRERSAGSRHSLTIAVLFFPLPGHPMLAASLAYMRSPENPPRRYMWGTKWMGQAFREHKDVVVRGKPDQFYAAHSGQWRDLWDTPGRFDDPSVIGLHLWWSEVCAKGGGIEASNIQEVCSSYPKSAVAEYCRRYIPESLREPEN